MKLTALVTALCILSGCATHSNPECRKGVAYSPSEYAILGLVCFTTRSQI